MTQVSIIVCTYNPIWEKLERTLKSAICQENVGLEIIIADDGSANNLFDKINTFMHENDFLNFKTLEHKNNVGIVKNLFDAMSLCDSEFCYCISPGDYFYEKTIISDLYQYAKETEANIVFGDAVYYSGFDEVNGRIELAMDAYPRPKYPEFYKKNDDRCMSMLLMDGNNILGAAYFRTLESAKKYIGFLVGKVKYLEDYPSLIYALKEKENIKHYPNYVVWYEYGTGISTSVNNKWKELLNKDRIKGLEMIKGKYIEDKALQHMLNYSEYSNNKFSSIKYILRTFSFFLIFWKIRIVLYKTMNKPHTANLNPIKYDMIEAIYSERY